MTIRRQWLLVLTLTAVLTVCINSLLLASLINRYFVSYTVENYNNHLSQIEELAKNALSDYSYSGKQLAVQLESHLDDPIVSIKLYDAEGQLIASAYKEYANMHGMMNGMMKSASEEVDSIDISDSGIKLGELNITRYSSLNNSTVASMFKFALIRNSVLSFGVVLLVLLIIGLFISRKMSRDLTSTAAMALSIDLGNQSPLIPSKVKEIRIIQTSLETLSSRLKIKQIGRKRLIDELVHQVRTPLTIIKTHLEGFSDGVIEMTPEEIDICEEQIENITSIITNMSMMLDAGRPSEAVKPEKIEINHLLRQIVSGMKVQFDNKKINLKLLSHQRVIVSTDKYMLSQCIYNIFTNAYKFTDPNGEVTISYEISGSDLSIIIKDSGIGISADDKQHLFDAYYRGSNSNKVSGEGLGLFVVKENLDKLGGKIKVISDPGSGSTFTITIPVN